MFTEAFVLGYSAAKETEPKPCPYCEGSQDANDYWKGFEESAYLIKLKQEQQWATGSTRRTHCQVGMQTEQ